jgi:hypothetical protein
MVQLEMALALEHHVIERRKIYLEVFPYLFSCFTLDFDTPSIRHHGRASWRLLTLDSLRMLLCLTYYAKVTCYVVT